MEKRITIVYILTSIALVLLLITQGLWLHSQYRQITEQKEAEVVEVVKRVIEIDRKTRSKYKSTDEKETAIVISHSSNIDFSMDEPHTKNVINISISLADSTYVFVVDDGVNQQDRVFDAPMRFVIDEANPLSINAIDSLLQREGVRANLSKIRFDSMVWEGKSSIERGLLTVDMPYDNLQGECVRVEYKIPLVEIIQRMRTTFTLSLLLSLLLGYCFIYQIRTIQQQRKVNEVRQDFLHTMIHELKRPISTLKMCVSSLRNEKLMQNNDFKEEVLQNSYKELDNLSSYFAKLRDVTMADSGAIPLNITKIELPTLVEELIPRISISSSKRVGFDMKTCETVSINADNLHLQNILHNLIENSIKYSEEEVTIALSYYIDDSFLTIEVSDNGRGISPSDLPYIFDKFYRGRNLNSISGIGLGLSYVKMLTEAHRGTISVESTLNVGTKFTIKLPL